MHILESLFQNIHVFFSNFIFFDLQNLFPAMYSMIPYLYSLWKLSSTVYLPISASSTPRMHVGNTYASCESHLSINFYSCAWLYWTLGSPRTKCSETSLETIFASQCFNEHCYRRSGADPNWLLSFYSLYLCIYTMTTKRESC